MTRVTNSAAASAPATRPDGPTLFAGDPHGRLDQVFEAVDATHASCVVLLGDIEPGRPLEDEMEPLTELGVAWYFVAGNHDADSDAVAQRVWNPRTEFHNVHARVVALPSGLTLAGLAGIWRDSVWNPASTSARAGQPVWRSRQEHAHSTPRQHRWEGRLPPRRHLASIYPVEVDQLKRMSADILVTHEAPGYHPHGFGELDGLARSMGARLVVHGHHHDALDSSALWAKQGFESHGVGLRGVSALYSDGSWQTVVEGERTQANAAKKAGGADE